MHSATTTSQIHTIVPFRSYSLRHQCIHCPKDFATNLSLRRHQSEKHDRIRFPCEYCDKTFTQKNSVKLHKRNFHAKALASEEKANLKMIPTMRTRSSLLIIRKTIPGKSKVPAMMAVANHNVGLEQSSTRSEQNVLDGDGVSQKRDDENANYFIKIEDDVQEVPLEMPVKSAPFCTECGTKFNSAEDNFCRKCGTRRQPL